MKFDLPDRDIKGVMMEIRKLTKLGENEDIIRQAKQVLHWLRQIYEFAVDASTSCQVQMFNSI